MTLRPYSDGTEHFAAVEVRGGRRRLRAAFRIPRPSHLRAAWLRCRPDGEAEYREMRLVQDGPWERWEAAVSLRGTSLAYRFILQDHDGHLWHFDQRGLHATPPHDDASFVHLDEPPPSWLRGTTFYQIFPDRFAQGNGDTSPAQRAQAAQLPLPRASVELEWGERHPGYRNGGESAFMGGDLVGIRTHLDHLKSLGVGALYLTPIFLAGSYHRYDTWDYQEIDPRLGTGQDLSALCRELHVAGMRIILDGVFNHVGAGHRWFNRREVFAEPGAYQDADSPFAEFFIFQRHPDRYENWLGIKELVKLDYRSRRVREAIYGGPDSVIRRWLRPPYSIDGWRLDVANMIGRCGPVQSNHEVLAEMRQAMKDTDCDKFMLGENFFDATSQLQGDQLDSVQDYHGFYFPVLRWLTGCEPQIPRGLRSAPTLDLVAGGAEQLAASLLEARARVPFAVAQALFHQLGSHDTPRILTVLDGDEDRLKLAVFLLLIWPGTPCVYYGDEVGLEGGRDPENRRAMPWNEKTWKHDLLEYYRRLINLRRTDEVFADGGVRVIHAEGDVFCFLRILGDKVRLAALNRGDRPRAVELDLAVLGWTRGEVVDLLSQDGSELVDGRLTLTLPTRGVRLLRLEDHQ